MKKLFCWWKRPGRPKNERERVRVHFSLDVELHERLLTEAGKERVTLTDMLNICLSVGLSVLGDHPEIVPILRSKFVQTPKNNPAD